MQHFAGFELRDIGGIPVLSLRDRRFKTFRVSLYARRTLDDSAAARAMLPGLLLQGTERDPDRPALARHMQDLYGAVVHPSTSKLGESHVLGFGLDAVTGRCLPGMPDQLGNGLGLLADLLARPRLVDGGFPSEVFERERTQTANAIRALADDKGSWAIERALACACEGEPMAIPEHGGLAAVEALDRFVPERARQDFLRHGECWSVAMGNLPEDAELERRMAEFAAELPERQPQSVADPVVIDVRAPRRTVEHADVRQSKLVLVFRAPRIEDVRTRVGRNLFVSMLGGGPHSRLFVEVREKRSLAYYASANADRHKGLVLIQVGLDGERTREAEEEIVRQMAAMQAGQFEERELETARHVLLSSLRAVDDSIAQRVRFTSEQWLQRADRTPEQVAAIARESGPDDVVTGGAGIWLDHSYLLTPGAAE